MSSNHHVRQPPLEGGAAFLEESGDVINVAREASEIKVLVAQIRINPVSRPRARRLSIGRVGTLVANADLFRHHSSDHVAAVAVQAALAGRSGRECI